MERLSAILPGIAAYPDLHPMAVHFPVALFPSALLLWILALWRYPHLLRPALLLLVLGTAAAGFAIFTGLRAQALMPHGPSSLVAVHRSLMLATGGLALLLSLATVPVLRTGTRTARFSLLAGLIVLNALVVLGADRGALVSLRFRGQLAAGTQPPTAPGEPVTEAGGKKEGESTKGGDPTRGEALYTSLRCGACHDRGARLEAPGIPPSLQEAGSRFRQPWIRAYLMTPWSRRWIDEGLRPLVRMPDFRLDSRSAGDLASYLAGRTAPERFPEEPVARPFGREEIESGRKLFHEYACRGCHALDGRGTLLGPDLSDAGERLRPAWVYAFLKAPKEVVPGTPMKDFGLWDDEARQLTAFIMTLRAGDSAKGASASHVSSPQTNRAQPEGR